MAAADTARGLSFGPCRTLALPGLVPDADGRGAVPEGLNAKRHVARGSWMWTAALKKLDPGGGWPVSRRAPRSCAHAHSIKHRARLDPKSANSLKVGTRGLSGSIRTIYKPVCTAHTDYSNKHYRTDLPLGGKPVTRLRAAFPSAAVLPVRSAGPRVAASCPCFLAPLLEHRCLRSACFLSGPSAGVRPARCLRLVLALLGLVLAWSLGQRVTTRLRASPHQTNLSSRLMHSAQEPPIFKPNPGKHSGTTRAAARVAVAEAAAAEAAAPRPPRWPGLAPLPVRLQPERAPGRHGLRAQPHAALGPSRGALPLPPLPVQAPQQPATVPAEALLDAALPSAHTSSCPDRAPTRGWPSLTTAGPGPTS